MAYDILIKNAKTRDTGSKLMQIAIEKGKIVKIAEEIAGEAKQTIDANSNLVTGSFINGHLHLDKVYTLAMMDDEAISAYTDGGMGGAMTAIELASNVKKKYDEPKTPYQRLMAMPEISPEAKRRLKAEYATLNPAQLKREITRLQEKLFKTAASRRRARISTTIHKQANNENRAI